jgi:hypothetical protein
MSHALIPKSLRYHRTGMKLATLRSAFVRVAPLLLICLASCKKDGEVPSFVRLSPPNVRTADGLTEIPSNITDMWVFANGAPLGVWQADRRIPVLEKGITSLQVIAGVRRNGIASDRIQYPFLATYNQDITLQEGAEVLVQPVFNYFDEAFPFVEGFEEAGQVFITSEGDTGFYRFNADVPEEEEDVLTGAWSGGIFLDPTHDLFRAVSSPDQYFPNGSLNAFLELDYRSDTRFLVGVRFLLGGQTYTIPLVYVSPTKLGDGTMPWKHIYLDLGSAWGTSGTVLRQLYIEAVLENGATSAKITLDNVKVVY